jgi:hypothetical protein
MLIYKKEAQMKIFLLKRINGITERDETAGMVVVARNEDDARRVAGTLNPLDEVARGYGDEGAEVWQDSSQTSCEVVGDAADHLRPSVLCASFVAA